MVQWLGARSAVGPTQRSTADHELPGIQNLDRKVGHALHRPIQRKAPTTCSGLDEGCEASHNASRAVWVIPTSRQGLAQAMICACDHLPGACSTLHSLRHFASGTAAGELAQELASAKSQRSNPHDLKLPQTAAQKLRKAPRLRLQAVGALCELRPARLKPNRPWILIPKHPKTLRETHQKKTFFASKKTFLKNQKKTF